MSNGKRTTRAATRQLRELVPSNQLAPLPHQSMMSAAHALADLPLAELQRTVDECADKFVGNCYVDRSLVVPDQLGLFAKKVSSQYFLLQC